MVSAFTIVFAVFTLIRFAILQWRAIWTTSANHPISDAVQAKAGIDAASIDPRDFRRLADLCNQVCASQEQGGSWLREVGIYYRGVAVLDQIFSAKVPAVSAWAKREMQICSRYAAVLLDQGLTMSMDAASAS